MQFFLDLSKKNFAKKNFFLFDLSKKNFTKIKKNFFSGQLFDLGGFGDKKSPKQQLLIKQITSYSWASQLKQINNLFLTEIKRVKIHK